VPVLALPDLSGLEAADWAQVAAAFFTAIAAGAAWASVWRAEADRRRARVPDLHVELLVDMEAEEVRLTIANYGGPAREVRVYGVLGDFGFGGYVPPTTYWRAGESRTVKVAMPPVRVEESHVFVEGRDMAKRRLVIGTVGGATYDWPLRKAKKLSAEKEWQKLFPGVPGPLDVKYTPMNISVIARHA
jgi:hypothetical protein